MLAILTIRAVDPFAVIDIVCQYPPLPSMTPTQRRAYCKRRGLLALSAEEDGVPAGYAVAESDPREVQVLTPEGTPVGMSLQPAAAVRRRLELKEETSGGQGAQSRRPVSFEPHLASAKTISRVRLASHP